MRNDDGKIIIRYDTLENWERVNPVIEFGELIGVLNTDKSTKLKVGNGEDKFLDLKYV